MTIDFWGLGLQAVNVLILVWLLSRVFWRPVAAAIAKRQDTAKSVIETAQATQAKADATLVDVAHARAGIAHQRTAILEAAKDDAKRAAKTILADARAAADALISVAKTAITKDADLAQKANATQATELSFKIAAKLLERLNSPDIQSAFLTQLGDAITNMPAADRKKIATDTAGIEIVVAADGGTDKAATQLKISKSVHDALGANPDLRFVVDRDLIAGLELRTPHFILHNSWQADLIQIQKAMNDDG